MRTALFATTLLLAASFAGAQDYTDVVTAHRPVVMNDAAAPATLKAIAADLNSRERLIKYGLLIKTAGAQCGGYSCDIICQSNGYHYDVFIDAGGAWTPHWALVVYTAEWIGLLPADQRALHHIGEPALIDPARCELVSPAAIIEPPVDPVPVPPVTPNPPPAPTPICACPDLDSLNALVHSTFANYESRITDLERIAEELIVRIGLLESKQIPVSCRAAINLGGAKIPISCTFQYVEAKKP